MKDHFTAGEFARLCNVKKQTLFHYDDIDVLKPDIRGENGYRYYSYQQLEEFSMISMLRDLDMPLAEIKKYVDRRSPENLIALLEKEDEEARKKIEELEWARHYISTRLRITKEAMKIKYGKMLVQDLEAEYYVTTKYSGDDSDLGEARNFSRHMNYCHDLDVYSAYSAGAMIPSADIGKRGYHYSHFCTKLDEKDDSYNHIKPAGKYLVYYDNEGYSNLEAIAGRMIAYAVRRKMKYGQYFYEDTILDALSGRTWDDYSIKISLRIDY